jgi:adenosylcobinamide-GDP ribazoletransferase
MHEPFALLHDLAACLRFYSRLPVPRLPGEADAHAMPDFGRAIRMLPLAGAIIACLAALVLALALGLSLPVPVASALALASLVLTTGAFHEDGLADTADGFGGGATIARKLEIMRDSRIGSYGAAALVLALLLRWSALTALAARGIAPAAAAMIAVAAVSRTAGTLPLALLPPARVDGVAYAAARPRPLPCGFAWCLCAALSFAPYAAGIQALPAAAAPVVAVAAALAVTALARRQIGGQTGDVAGAAQQCAEIAGLCALCAAI